MTRSSPASPPATESELLARAKDLAGMTLGELAASFGKIAPVDLRRAKGFSGQLLETALGATASSRPAPDFESLAVELKTIPVRADGTPCESTFVCTIDISRIGDVEWESSLVRKKLARVLFIPVEGDRSLLVEKRRIGSPLLWSPSADDEASLKFDWEELAGIIGRGDVEAVTGHLGRFLQVRPKAADSHARRRGVDADGVPFATLPRGFYLRATFTARIIAAHFATGAPQISSPSHE
jgi:DNA mismatch repair protein MutH